MTLTAHLIVRGGKHEGRTIPLPAGRFLIGREQDCDLRPSSDLISRHHCVFHVDQYSVRLRDLGSTNGTEVNGSRLVGEKVLEAGDRVKVGKLDFELVVTKGEEQQAPSADPAPSDVLNETEVSASETTYDLPVVPSDAAGSGERQPAGGPQGQPVPYPYGQQPGQPMPGMMPGYGYPYPPPGYGYPPPGYQGGMPPGWGPQQGGPPQPAGPGGDSDGGKTKELPVRLPPPPKKS